MLRVAYQGVEGAYSEAAIFETYSDGTSDSQKKIVKSLPCQSFDDVFKSVIDGTADEALIPIENSAGGSIHTNYDLLLHYRLYIIQEIDFQVRHNLLALPETKMEDIRIVFSHPQALAQCNEYLRALIIKYPKIVVESSYDTAGSAKMIKEGDLKHHAAIASNRAAEVYGLKIIDKGIEDEKSNFTRFLLLSLSARTPPLSVVSNNVKTSIVFCMKSNTPGQLFKALSEFALRDVDLSKIESRPGKSLRSIIVKENGNTSELDNLPEERYPYFFYIDFIAHVESDAAKSALRHLSEIVSFIVVLGTYPVYVHNPKIQISRSKCLMALSKKSPNESVTNLKIGIIGFGNFGQFLSDRFIREGHSVVATSRTDYSVTAYNSGVSHFYTSLQEFCEIEGPKLDCLVISVSILAFQKIVDKLQWDYFKNVLVVDVLSVKEYPKTVLTKSLETYPSIDILCTHPMFGPESGASTWKDLPFVYHKVHIQNEERFKTFIGFFEKQGCRMIPMQSNIHDSMSAGSQFITHFTGRVLDQLDISSSSINTKGFESLLTLVDNTVRDTFDLFYALYRFNENSGNQLALFEKAFNTVKTKLIRFDKNQEKENDPDISFNPLVEKVKLSGTAAIHDWATKLRSEGIPVIGLVAGELHVPTHPKIIDASIKALESGNTKYTPNAGTLELREAISKKLKVENELDYEANQIVISNGAKQSLSQTVTALCRPYDEVLIVAPYWTSYKEMIVLAGATPVVIQTRTDDRFHLKAKDLRHTLEQHPFIRLFMICYPNNPSGALYTFEELESFAEVLRDFPNVFIISDEIYEKLILEPSLKFRSFATLRGMKDRTITVNGFSKAFAMTGFRIGYLAAPLRIAQCVAKIQSQTTGCPSSIGQSAALAAFDIGDEFMKETIADLLAKRTFLMKAIKDIPDIECPIPDGAFYIFFIASKYFGSVSPEGQVLSNADEICGHLVRKYNVAVVPGSAFGYPSGIRISFSTSMENLKDGMKSITKCFSELVRLKQTK